MESSQPDETALCFATREAILLELRRRYDAIVLITSKSIDDSDSHLEWDYKCSGGQLMALGLVEAAKQTISREIANDCEFTDPPNEDVEDEE